MVPRKSNVGHSGCSGNNFKLVCALNNYRINDLWVGIHWNLTPLWSI